MPRHVGRNPSSTQANSRKRLKMRKKSNSSLRLLRILAAIRIVASLH